MFKKNTEHEQKEIFGFENTLDKKKARLLKKSEEYSFYELVYSKIKEEDFSVLYSREASRPNAPINAMLGSIILMHRKNWTYRELFNNMNFNDLTKYALGCAEKEEAPFCTASLFNFQTRLLVHSMETGENLIEKMFDNITSSELKTLKIKTNIQRTDSFQAHSNIRNYSRLQLIIEVLLRLYKVITEEEKESFKEIFSNYVEGTSENYVMDIKKDELPHRIKMAAKAYKKLYNRLNEKYAGDPTFKIFERVYHEQFEVVENKVYVKEPKKIKSSCLQSPDDIDATYRNKNDKGSKGQVVSIVETANPDNEINLITDVVVRANNVNDSEILNDRIDILKEKTPELDEIHFDGAYGSPDSDIKFDKYGITAIQTAIKGVEPAVDIKIMKINNGEYEVSCPNQKVKTVLSAKKYKAEFELSICSECLLKEKCPTIKNKQFSCLYFYENEYLKKRRKEAIDKLPKERQQLRNNVEATVSEFKRKMHSGKLKVRGYFKTMIFAFSMAVSINFGRIFRYTIGQLSLG